MKNGQRILQLVFGLMGAIYAALGSVFLVVAVTKAGGIGRIFALQEDQLAFAINGVVFTALGLIFLLVMIILLFAGRRRARMREELLSWGTRIPGEVAEVRVDYTVRVNRRNPVIARVRCQIRGSEVTLKSPRLWEGIPAVGDPAEVIYDPMDETRYVIEFRKK